MRIKPEFASAPLSNVLERIPGRYHPMMSALWERLGSLEMIQANENDGTTYEIAAPFIDEANDIHFDSRYRESCLKQIIRSTFFDTLITIENAFNWDKANWYVPVKPNQIIQITVEGEADTQERPEIPEDMAEKTLFLGLAEDMITETQWSREMSADESFCRVAIEAIKQHGYDVKPGWACDTTKSTHEETVDLWSFVQGAIGFTSDIQHGGTRLVLTLDGIPLASVVSMRDLQTLQTRDQQEGASE
jgi:hypothetical protein